LVRYGQNVAGVVSHCSAKQLNAQVAFQELLVRLFLELEQVVLEVGESEGLKVREKDSVVVEFERVRKRESAESNTLALLVLVDVARNVGVVELIVRGSLPEFGFRPIAGVVHIKATSLPLVCAVFLIFED